MMKTDLTRRKRIIIKTGMLAAVLFLAGCGNKTVYVTGDAETRIQEEPADGAGAAEDDAGTAEDVTGGKAEEGPDTDESAAASEGAEQEEPDGIAKDAPDTEDASESEAAPDTPEVLDFVDVFGQQYQVDIIPNIEKNSYEKEDFIHDRDQLIYAGDGFDSRTGIDVSSHNGTIDWQKTADQGYEFVFIRIGFRGYGESGSLNVDRKFEENYTGARDAGLDVGVYFFSQAVNETEAEEEADLVLEILEGRELQLPVVYDPESILDDEARTDDVSGAQFTADTEAFCSRIREAGYEPMVYSNMLWEAYELDLTQLSDIPIWYADYEPAPQTPYRFSFWQYSNTGSVEGVDGPADLDIQLTKK